MNEAEKEFKKRGTITKKVTVPVLMWEEWEKDCVDNFNNTYSLKMQFDHEFRKEFNNIANLLVQDILELKEQVFELKAELAELQQEPEEKERKTFG